MWVCLIRCLFTTGFAHDFLHFFTRYMVVFFMNGKPFNHHWVAAQDYFNLHFLSSKIFIYPQTILLKFSAKTKRGDR